MTMSSAQTIAKYFNRAAPVYDEAASVQSRVAQLLLRRAAISVPSPTTILDIGCGTGFVSIAAHKLWPKAKITALDHAYAMVRQTKVKAPCLQTIVSDITEINFGSTFDLVLSSMMLHWIPNPYAELLRWRKWLKPKGRIQVSLLTEGSFQEWRELCKQASVKDGLWPMPRADFADHVDCQSSSEIINIAYSSAHDFLQRLKITGAAMPQAGYRSLNPAAMRQLLREAPKPFTVSYRVLYLEIVAPSSI